MFAVAQGDAGSPAASSQSQLARACVRTRPSGAASPMFTGWTCRS